MRLNLSGSAQRRILAFVPALLVVLIGALTYDRARGVVADVSEIERSHEAQQAAGLLLNRALDAETGQRAYLLTGDSTFLEPYNGSHRDADKALSRLKTLVQDNSSQTIRTSTIGRLLNERFALLETDIRRRRSGEVRAASNSTAQIVGKLKMDQLRAAIAELQASEEAILNARHAAERRGVTDATTVIVGAFLAALILSALINVTFSRALERQDKANAELRRLNEDLERQAEQLETQAAEMESQAAELEATSEDLRAINDELSSTTAAAELSRDAAENARLQLESVLRSMPDAASMFDNEWRWVYVNPAGAQLLAALGTKPDNVKGMKLWDALPQLKGTRFESETERAKREGVVATFENYLASVDGWFENSVVPVPGAVMVFTRDITRRKREEEGAKLLAEASRALASSLDYETTLQVVARLAVGELADWCAVDLVSSTGAVRQVVVSHVDEAKVRWAKELSQRYPADYEAPSGVGNVIRTGKPEVYRDISDDMLVASAIDADHLEIMRELQFRSALIVPMIARGRTVGALTLVSTEGGRRYGDEDLALATELGTRAAIAIDNAQLYRSALAASEAKSAFLATMSHELRTPLNAIIGYQALLKEGIFGSLTDEQILQLNRIRTSADHLLTLIDEILTFSRVEAGKEVARKEEVVLRSVVDDAVGMVSPAAEAKGLALHVEGDAGSVFTDGGKVRQILLNLLSNAIKFTDTGDIRVRLGREDDEASIAVIDTGIGIAAEHLERVFEPFWQVEQRTTRRAGGTGLGLSVSRRLARLIGGQLRVESEPGKGSTFTLMLPTAGR